ncbi:TetR/AcrR family transcriptional regulator [Sphingobium sp. Sx8-8]|uniref:TetR/AcrR family transcriptional regulator n=1 Tax=Sphingobium sp. Sx8-8 TaxID=2933617 RepID=UPI001F56F255|nr:TetR/AcrR family transcriptional regulator [Sphingobium sp. Sx8-8]
MAIRTKPVSKGDETRERIKLRARELFAEHGPDRVTIRDIADAAGQKNGGSVNYYFRSKDDLILEILEEVLNDVDTYRGALLDELEQSGAPITVRAILKLLNPERPGTESAVPLLISLTLHRRDLMHTAVPGRWDKAYLRCIEHLRKLIPGYPEKILQQRLYFLIPYLWTFLKTREPSEHRAQFWRQFWADPSAYETLLDTAEGILMRPVSEDTLAAFRD